MKTREAKTIIYDDNGYKETIIEMVPDLPIPTLEETIQQKEQQLLQMYNELQALKEQQS